MQQPATGTTTVPNAARQILEDLPAFVQARLEQYKVPALSVAVLSDGEVHQAAAGCLNLNTGVEATTDAVFQIGSITKVMTASVIMQLVDEGRVALDDPVNSYLPDFCIADTEAGQHITLRHLLNHSSGMAGDFFPDDHQLQGNRVARYVDRCALLPQIHPVGQFFSYCNSGYCVAGRVIEVVLGNSWYQAIEERIFKPLGMDHAFADPVHALGFRTAIGHVPGDKTDTESNPWQVTQQPYLPLGVAPAGATITMSATDLISFGQAHLSAGFNNNGQPWLSTESVKAMQTPSMPLPTTSTLSDKFMGLGWGGSVFHEQNLSVFSHMGGTEGSLSMLVIIPELQCAFSILINALDNAAMAALHLELLAAFTGLSLQQPEAKVTAANDSLRILCGDYDSFYTRSQVIEKNQTLQLIVTHKIEPLPDEQYELRHLVDDSFATYNPQGQRVGCVVFLEKDPQGRARYLYDAMGRISQRQ